MIDAIDFRPHSVLFCLLHVRLPLLTSLEFYTELFLWFTSEAEPHTLQVLKSWQRLYSHFYVLPVNWVGLFWKKIYL